MKKPLKRSSSQTQRHTDTLGIRRGALGPIPTCSLDIKPFTVFVGRQGTGKSLAAQVLYFFEELPYLAAYAAASERESVRWTDAQVVRHLLDRLRSSDKAFATFANKSVRVEYSRSRPYSKLFGETGVLAFSAQKNNRKIGPNEALTTVISKARRHDGEKLRRAVFFPTERMVISQLRTAMSERLLSLPLTYTLFSDWMELASQAIASSKPGTASEATWVARQGAEALGGHTVRRGDQWKWHFKNGVSGQFDIDMASSGQRANWSLIYLAQALFSLRDSHVISKGATLFVEEPEIHLHPAAQVVILHILAFLVGHGFRVVITTHSLSVLYALNNLIQADQLHDASSDVPAPAIRLHSRDVAVYAFEAEKKPRDLMDHGTGFIDETELGRVADDLSAELNRIGVRIARQERAT